jgi:hypothetical protein
MGKWMTSTGNGIFFIQKSFSKEELAAKVWMVPTEDSGFLKEQCLSGLNNQLR